MTGDILDSPPDESTRTTWIRDARPARQWWRRCCRTFWLGLGVEDNEPNGIPFLFTSFTHDMIFIGFTIHDKADSGVCDGLI